VAGGSLLPSGNYASTALALNGLYSFTAFGREDIRTYEGLDIIWLTEVDIDFEPDAQERSFSGTGPRARRLRAAVGDVRCRLAVLRPRSTDEARRFEAPRSVWSLLYRRCRLGDLPVLRNLHRICAVQRV
jgi:hypothetical protein